MRSLRVRTGLRRCNPTFAELLLESPVVVVVRWDVLSVLEVGVVARVDSIGDHLVSQTSSIVQQHMDTIILADKLSHSHGQNVAKLIVFISEVGVRVLISWNSEDVFVVPLSFRGSSMHWKSVSGHMNPSRVFWEGPHSSSTPQTEVCVPVGEVRSGVVVQIVEQSLAVEVPVVLSWRRHREILLEDFSPLGIGDQVVEIVGDGSLGSVQVESRDGIQISSNFSEAFVVGVVDGGIIQPNEPSESIAMIASSSQGHLRAQSMSTDRSSTQLVLIHEYNHIVGQILAIETLMGIRAAKISGIQQPHIPMFQNLVSGVHKELHPVFGLIEHLREEQHSWEVLISPLQMYAPQIDILVIFLRSGSSGGDSHFWCGQHREGSRNFGGAS